MTAIIATILILDQLLKLYIKLHYTLGEAVEVFPWFQLCFVENPGMAFGITWLPKWFLTIFRIGAASVLCWYLHALIGRGARMGYIVAIAMVTAGAMGNIIDCLLYGQIFSESTFTQLANFVPFGQGYAPVFYGKVVDMFYFPLIHNAAGEVIFFRPVFNLADSAITVSVFLILLFFRKDLNESMSSGEPAADVE